MGRRLAVRNGRAMIAARAIGDGKRPVTFDTVALQLDGLDTRAGRVEHVAQLVAAIEIAGNASRSAPRRVAGERQLPPCQDASKQRMHRNRPSGRSRYRIRHPRGLAADSTECPSTRRSSGSERPEVLIE